MPRTLPRALRAELEWAINTCSAFGDASPDQSRQIRAAVEAASPMLYKRFCLFVDNSRPWSEEMGREETNRIGALMLALDAHAKGEPYRLYQPGEWDHSGEGRADTQIQFRCTASWKARLQAYCQRSGQDASGVIRKSVEAYLAGNPLWKGLSAEEGEPDNGTED